MGKLLKPSFLKGTFVASFVDPKHIPHFNLHEIALAGRSNVGKSSLINNLLRSQNLAKTSSTPGKTVTLNFFNIEDCFHLVDLPGYGFAKTSKEERAKWSLAIDTYLNTRKELKLILLLLDIRHPLQEEDLLFIDWTLKLQKPLLLIFTKTDKLSFQELQAQVARMEGILQPLYGGKVPPYVLYSIKDPKARIRLIHLLWDLFTKTLSSA